MSSPLDAHEQATRWVFSQSSQERAAGLRALKRLDPALVEQLKPVHWTRRPAHVLRNGVFPPTGEIDWLRLSDGGLEAFPEALLGLQRLRHLNLDSNTITTLPEALGSLRGLRSLSLDRSGLTRLFELGLDHNFLVSLPDDYFAPYTGTLRKVYLEHNLLHRLPASLAGCRRLWQLRVQQNPLDVPSTLEMVLRMKELVSLELPDTFLPHEAQLREALPQARLHFHPWRAWVPSNDPSTFDLAALIAQELDGWVEEESESRRYGMPL